MEITLNAIVKTPDRTVHGVFGDNLVPGTAESVQIIVDIEPLIEKIVQALKP